MEKKKNEKPRGIRNNNPGNIRNSEANEWLGEVAAKQKRDEDFEEFEDMAHGVRAMMCLLIKYQRGYNLNTIRELVGRWAPRNENDTDLYVRLVSDEMGVPACCGIDLSDKGTLCALVDAMVYVENGVHIPKADIEAGYELM